jgi:nitrate reductase gamma subunit
VWTWNIILFEVFPCIAIGTAVVGGIYRYHKDKFSYSSFSSQILENRMLFWGSMMFHYGIIAVLLAHLWQGLWPGWSIAWLATPFTTFVFEISGYIIGYAANVGLAILIVRRIIDPKVRKVTTIFDWILLFDLQFQMVVGTFIAHTYRWGTLWYNYTATPWFESISYINPNAAGIVNLPWWVKAHAFNCFVIFFLFPFTRLVHIFTFPVTYVWRPFQMVIWNSWKTFRKAF